jgi:hypothetical protein
MITAQTPATSSLRNGGRDDVVPGFFDPRQAGGIDFDQIATNMVSIRRAVEPGMKLEPAP